MHKNYKRLEYKPNIGNITYHKYLGKCYVHSLEKFNVNSNTLCVVLDRMKDMGVKVLDLKDFYILVGSISSIEENILNDDTDIKILSNFLKNIWWPERDNIDEKIKALKDLDEYLMSFAKIKDNYLIKYISDLNKILKEAGINFICEEVKRNIKITNKVLLNALQYLMI